MNVYSWDDANAVRDNETLMVYNETIRKSKILLKLLLLEINKRKEKRAFKVWRVMKHVIIDGVETTILPHCEHKFNGLALVIEVI